MASNVVIKPKVPREGWTLAGNISVDTGRIVIGDPCHIGDLIDNDDFQEELTRSFSCHPGHDAGVSIETGLGDGVYPVYANIKDFGSTIGKRVTAVFINFMEGSAQ